MKRTILGAAVTAATLAFATGAFAVGPPYCEDYAAPSITAPAEGNAAQCQKAIVKNTQKYLKSLLKIRSKCLTQGIYDACPNTEDDTDAQEAAVKALEGIAGACGDTAGLGTSYNGASAANAGSCTLSQNHGTAEIYLAETNGNGTDPTGNPASVDCQGAINKASQKFLPSILKSVDKCIDGNIKKGENLLTLGVQCVGSTTGGVYTPPLDTKTAEAIVKATTKMTGALDKECTGLSTTQISSLFSCPLATTEADLDACVRCSGLNAMFEIVDSQWAEDGQIVSPGAGAIQAAISAGDAGDKFLIASGNYEEGVTLPLATCTLGGSCPANNMCSAVSQHPGDACTTNSDCLGTCDVASGNSGDDCTLNSDCTGTCDGASDNPGAECDANDDCPNGACEFLGACQIGSCEDACPGLGNDCTSDGDNMQIVGCGAATDDRPRVIPPAVLPPTRGFLATGVDGLHFQALELTGWENDGVFVNGAAGASFRDILGNGDDLSTVPVDSVTTYAVFPVKSSDVMVEGCEVFNVRDAGVYVGQSDGVVMRHNLVYENVAGMELENSLNGVMYGNNTFGNTGGILVFKLNGPEHQVAGFHHVFDNTSYENDLANFAIPGTTVAAVPRGTGMMVISDDNSTYENNWVVRNDSYGFLLVDQEAVNILVSPPPFVPTSYDQDMSNITFLDNRVFSAPTLANGNAPGPEILFSGNWTWAINTGPNGTCWNSTPANVKSAQLGVSSFPICP